MFDFKVLAFAAVAVLSAFAGMGPAAAQVVQGEEHCVVNIKTSDVLNLRQRPDANSRIWATFRYAQCGLIVTGECRGLWCPVEDGHHSGWVNSRYISMVSPAMYCVAGVPTGDVLNVRAYPSANSRIVTMLPRNQCDIAFLPYSNGVWQKVRATGYEGWVNRSFVSGQ